MLLALRSSVIGRAFGEDGETIEVRIKTPHLTVRRSKKLVSRHGNEEAERGSLGQGEPEDHLLGDERHGTMLSEV